MLAKIKEGKAWSPFLDWKDLAELELGLASIQLILRCLREKTMGTMKKSKYEKGRKGRSI